MGIGNALFRMSLYNEFVNFLKSLSGNVDKSLEETAQEIIELAVNEIQSRLYPGHGYLTGVLHDSYHGSYKRSGASSINIEIGTDILYAPFVEFKWGGRYAHFYPAIQSVQEQIPEIMGRNINLYLKMGEFNYMVPTVQK